MAWQLASIGNGLALLSHKIRVCLYIQCRIPGPICYIIHLCSDGNKYEASFSAPWLRAKTIMWSLCCKEIGQAHAQCDSVLSRTSQICSLFDFPSHFFHLYLLISAKGRGKPEAFADCHLYIPPSWYFLINLTLSNENYVCGRRIWIIHSPVVSLSTCHYTGSKLTWLKSVYHFCHF